MDTNLDNLIPSYRLDDKTKGLMDDELWALKAELERSVRIFKAIGTGGTILVMLGFLAFLLISPGWPEDYQIFDFLAMAYSALAILYLILYLMARKKFYAGFLNLLTHTMDLIEGDDKSWFQENIQDISKLVASSHLEETGLSNSLIANGIAACVMQICVLLF